MVALREIEFDRETGKLSDADYSELKARYTEAAVLAMRQEDAAPAAALAASLMALTGCGTMSDRETAGTVGGAVVGGVVGNAVGGTTGAVLGAGAGAYVGNKAAK